MKKILILITFISINYCANSQNLDSLINIVNTTDEDSIKFETLLRISDTYYSIGDSLKCEVYKNQALDLFNSNNDLQTLNSYLYLSMYYEKFDNDLSMNYLEQAFEKAEEYKDFEKYCSIGNSLGYYYTMKGDNQKSVEILLNVLKTIEKNKLYHQYQTTFLYLGFAYRNQEKYEKSMEYFKKSVQYADTVNNMEYYHVAINEIGNVFAYKENLDSALYYHKIALAIREKIGNQFYLSYSYNDIAGDYLHIMDYKSALYYYKKCIEIDKSYSDIWGLSVTYGNIARCYIEMNDIQLTKCYLDSAEINARITNIKPIYLELYSVKSKYFEMINDYKNALENYKLYITYKDSIFEEEANNQILELEAKYDSEKKDKELIKAKETEKRKNTIIYSFVVIIIISFISLILIIRLLMQKKQAYNQLKEKNEEINQQKEEIIAQRDEITIQKKELELKHELITGSINYAKRIQDAVLPKKDLITSILPEHLILYKPRDVVSGDFYFIKKINNICLIAAADCTGHGVPGAFMSMLGIALLNELVRNTEIQTPAQLLNELRFHLKSSLQQIGKKDEQQDGIDIAFCSINQETLEMSFAGAHNPCWIFRPIDNEELKIDNKKNKLSIINYQLLILEPDHQPIGIFIKEKPFTEHKFQLQKDDVIYLFSDGFTDQFGGEKNEKFKTKRFKELLSEICNLPLQEQKQILETKFNEWKSNHEQTDDVLVIGVKI